nr:alpha/beta hydrolase [Bradyrhizobium paxllaeri]
MKIHFGAGGWIQWPDYEEFSIEFMKLLGMAQEGGSLISECFLAAGRIDPSDGGESWYREWTRMAEANNARANASLERGHVLTAQSNWLRAINYYQASAFAFDIADKRQQGAIEAMRACARRYISHLTPAGEVVEIPWLEGHTFEGYFLPAPAIGRSPAVICMGDPGHRKEEYLFKVARYARERGMSLLAVDLFGSDARAKFEDVVGRPDLETSISCVMDYLTTRDDIDEHRIGILGDGAGSSFVARGVALDNRFAAAVCDGGIWDMQEQAFLMDRLPSGNSGNAGTDGVRFGRKFRCPILITLGAEGWLESDHATNLFERLKVDQPDVSLRIFEGSETASAQGHSDNPTLANEFIFDWMADRLKLAMN